MDRGNIDRLAGCMGGDGRAAQLAEKLAWLIGQPELTRRWLLSRILALLDAALGVLERAA
jgi:hypothetical protein